MARVALDSALRRDACFVCGATSGLVSLGRAAAGICQSCAPRLGETLLASSSKAISAWLEVRPIDIAEAEWPLGAPVPGEPTVSALAVGERGPLTPGEEAIASMLVEVDAELGAKTRGQPHVDLAIAYMHMGLAREALREAAKALAISGEAWVSTSALGVIFRNPVRPGGLAALANAVRARRVTL